MTLRFGGPKRQRGPILDGRRPRDLRGLLSVLNVWNIWYMIYYYLMWS